MPWGLVKTRGAKEKRLDRDVDKVRMTPTKAFQVRSPYSVSVLFVGDWLSAMGRIQSKRAGQNRGWRVLHGTAYQMCK